jgi:hypothetical protein
MLFPFQRGVMGLRRREDLVGDCRYSRKRRSAFAKWMPLQAGESAPPKSNKRIVDNCSG